MPKRFLLDTHVVVDIGTDGGFEELSAKVQRILKDPDVDLLLSVVSEAETAVKTRIGKLDLTKDQLGMICSSAAIMSYPLGSPIPERYLNCQCTTKIRSIA